MAATDDKTLTSYSHLHTGECSLRNCNRFFLVRILYHRSGFYTDSVIFWAILFNVWSGPVHCGPKIIPNPMHQSITRCSLFTFPGGKGTHRWMSCGAQMMPRHGHVDALGPRVCIACCSYMHFASVYVMHLPAPEDQSIAWCSLFTFSDGKGTGTCMACLA